jgi:hypothetical protein
MAVVKAATAKIEEHQREIIKAENSHSEHQRRGDDKTDPSHLTVKSSSYPKAGMAELADAAD